MRPKPISALSDERLAFAVIDFGRQLGISRSSVYKLIKAREIRTALIAGRRLVPASEATRLLSGAER
jgi:hypothetical protein